MSGEFNDRSDAAWVQLLQAERQAEVDRFNARRNIEWRLALALWAGFGLAANAIAEVSLTLCWRIAASVLVVALVVLHLFWVRNFMVSASPDNWEKGWALTKLIRSTMGIKERELKLRDEGEESDRAIIRWLRAEKHQKNVERKPRLLWGHYWQVIVTLVIGMLAGMAIWLTPSGPETDRGVGPVETNVTSTTVATTTTIPISTSTSTSSGP